MPHVKLFDSSAMIGLTLAPIPAPLPDAAALTREMDRFGIEQALAWHYGFGSQAKAQMNRRTLEAVRRSSRLSGCWVLRTSPTMRGEKLEDQARQLRDAGARAARIFADEGPTAGPVTLADFEFGPLLAALAERGVPLLLPADSLNGAPGAYAYGFERIDAICREHPRLPVVLLEPRYRTQPQLIALMRRHPRLYATISGLGMFRQIESLSAMVGASRFLFGTNLPYGDPALPLGALLYSGLSQSDKERIGGENLRELLGEVR
jgi:predicted TIM-barrel fold metal-dependent hydrolase